MNKYYVDIYTNGGKIRYTFKELDKAIQFAKEKSESKELIARIQVSKKISDTVYTVFAEY